MTVIIELVWGIGVGLLGLVIGSFAGAQVWRLRYQQLVEDKAVGEPYDKAELSRLAVLHKQKGHSDRSHCLRCGHTLAWYDLLPLLSWVSTKGKCRYCKQSIGGFEPFIELGVMAVFVASYLLWPYDLSEPTSVVLLGLWLGAVIPATILFAYDAKWSLLPDIANYALIVSAAAFAGVALYANETTPIELAGSLLVVAGLYGGIYYFSRWRYGEQATWVGFGDVKLSIALGLFALNWQTAFVLVFAANFIGTLLVLPGLLQRSIGRATQIPFGPLLLLGTLVAVLAGQSITEWYFQVLLVSPV